MTDTDRQSERLTDGAVLATARHFASGRVTAERGIFGPEFQPMNQKWRPKVAGQFVRNSGDPENGFSTKQEALSAGWKYRESCITFVSRATLKGAVVKQKPEEAKWFRLATTLGWRLCGWTDGYRATFILPSGATQEISSEAEEAISRALSRELSKENQ